MEGRAVGVCPGISSKIQNIFSIIVSYQDLYNNIDSKLFPFVWGGHLLSICMCFTKQGCFCSTLRSLCFHSTVSSWCISVTEILAIMHCLCAALLSALTWTFCPIAICLDFHTLPSCNIQRVIASSVPSSLPIVDVIALLKCMKASSVQRTPSLPFQLAVVIF